MSAHAFNLKSITHHPYMSLDIEANEWETVQDWLEKEFSTRTRPAVRSGSLTPGRGRSTTPCDLRHGDRGGEGLRPHRGLRSPWNRRTTTS